jgi:hypothetical protein
MLLNKVPICICDGHLTVMGGIYVENVFDSFLGFVGGLITIGYGFVWRVCGGGRGRGQGC